MQGRLFTLLDIGFPSYFVLLLTGFVFATAVGCFWAKRIGQDPDVVVDLGLAMLIAGVAGGRLLHVFADGYFWDYVHLCTDFTQVSWQISEQACLHDAGNAGFLGFGAVAPGAIGTWDAARNVCHPLGGDCFAWAKFWNGGLAYYGGFIGASLGAWFLLRRDRFPFWKAADMAGMVVPLGLAFGRMGCLLAGCCFGVPTASGVALTFPGGSPASEWQFKAGLLPSLSMASLPVHPTQLYESFGSLAIAAVLALWLHERKRYDGQVFIAFVGAYAALRFAIEFWRSDDRGSAAGLSTSQLIGLVLVVGALLTHQRLGRPKLRSP